MENNTFEMIDKYARELAPMLITGARESAILVKLDGVCYETAPEADLAALTCEDVKAVDEDTATFITEYKLLMESEELGAIIRSQTPYCLAAAKRGKPLTAALDDMAQIVGYQVQTVTDRESQIRQALKKATGCFVKNRGFTITTGRNLFEAKVALTVLEKSAEVDLKADAIGGAKPLPKAEADLMRMIYKKKYSASEQEVKSKEGKAKDE